jgi:D-inositol-3-phosphate glycosyltransferase
LGGKKTGGMNVYVRDLAKEFSSRGHLVEVFTRSQDACVPRLSHELGPKCRVVHIPAGPEAPISTEAVYDHLDEFVAGVRQYAEDRGRQYDIIHSHYWLSGMVARQLREVWGAPIVQMFHTLGLMKNEVSEFTGELASEIRIQSETEIMQFADRINAASPMEKTQMVWRYGAPPNRIVVTPLAVNHKRFYPIPQNDAKAFLDIPEEKRIVLFVGRIEPLKGIDTLLHAMERVFIQWPECCNKLALVVIGGDANVPREQMTDEMKHLQDMTNELGMEHLVLFLGKRSQDVLPYYYSAADVVVMPSHYESFGLVALEAMSCGTPVIASRVGGLSFTVVEGVTGYQVPDGDAITMADRILRVLQDDELRTQLGNQATEMAACYSWPDVASQLDDVFASLLLEQEHAVAEIRPAGVEASLESSLT